MSKADLLAKELSSILWQSVERDSEGRRLLYRLGLDEWVSSERSSSDDPVVVAADAFIFLVVNSDGDGLHLVLRGALAFLSENGWAGPTAAQLRVLAGIAKGEFDDPERVEDWFYDTFPE